MSDDRLSENAAIAPNTEITALAQQVATARDKLPLQHDTALYDALSDDEIRAERELAEWIRAQRRKQRRRSVVDELAADQRDRRTGTLIRRTDEADARWHRKALAARRRVSSADARLAQLYRRSEWSSRALIGVVVLGMVWAGVNVQRNLVPSGDMSDPLYWLSYGIEAMISIPIIVIMVAATTAARWGRELERGKVIVFELALLGTTIALNAGPHLAAGSFGRAAEFAIAPVMVGVVIWLHAWVSARYAMLIESASVELPGDTGYSAAERLASPAFPQHVSSLGADRQALGHTVMNGVAPELRSPLTDIAAVSSTVARSAAAHDPRETATSAAVATAGTYDGHDAAAQAADHLVFSPAKAAPEAGAGESSSAAAEMSREIVATPVQATGETVAVSAQANGTDSETTAVSAQANPTNSETTAVFAQANADEGETVDASAKAKANADKGRTIELLDWPVWEPAVRDTSASNVAPLVATTEATAAQAAERAYPHALRRPSADKPNAPGTLELIHKAAADHRRNGTDHATRTNGLRRIPVTTAAQSPAGEATGTDPVPEVTMHAGTVARDPDGDTAPITEPGSVHNDPQPPAAEPEQLTLTTEPAEQLVLQPELALHTEPVPEQTDSTTRSMALGPAGSTATMTVSEQPDSTATVPEQTDFTATVTAPEQTDSTDLTRVPTRVGTTASAPEPTSATAPPTATPDPAAAFDKPAAIADPVELDVLDEDDEDLPAPDDLDFDEDTEVRALARQVAHRSPFRLTLGQIEEILELTDQSWSARSIGSEVGVPSSTVTNIVEFAHKLRQPYAFTG
ncbi:MAG: hypothetical protein H5T78_09135 [Nocardia sp.]|nr:hypothetical protein [Nocardia sp.]